MSIHYQKQWIKWWWDLLFIELCTPRMNKNCLNRWIEWIIQLKFLSNILPEFGLELMEFLV